MRTGEGRSCAIFKCKRSPTKISHKPQNEYVNLNVREAGGEGSSPLAADYVEEISLDATGCPAQQVELPVKGH